MAASLNYIVSFIVWAALCGPCLAAYNPILIVPNITSDCPVPNVQYPPEQYQTSTLITVFAPLAQQIPRQECVQQATSLAVCAFDGSLGVKSGCCSSACASQMKQLADINCFTDILNVICGVTPEQQAQVEPFVPILAGVAERCANYQAPPAVTCPNGRVIPTGVGGAAAYGAGAPAAEGPMPELGAGAALPGAAGGPVGP